MKTPSTGYLLPNWDNKGTYRATAIAYLQQENLPSVENVNGNWYTLQQLKDSCIISESISAINPNSELTEKIYQAHMDAFKEGKMPYQPGVRRFKSKQAVADAVRSGEIIPEIWKEVALHVLSTTQVIGLYSLLSFSSPKAEAKFKESFAACIENLLS